jgi:hypothetical protein
MSLGKELITYKDELYWVYRKVKEGSVKNIEMVKEFWQCDITLKHNGVLLFCRHIPNVEIQN